MSHVIYAELSLKTLFGLLPVQRDKACVVDKDIDLIETLFYLLCEVSDRVVIAKICQDKLSSAITVFQKLFVSLFAALFAAAQHNDCRTFIQKRSCSRHTHA